jgi:aminopeptidase N
MPSLPFLVKNTPIACWICCCFVWAQTPAPGMPLLPIPRERLFDIQHIALDLQLDFALRKVYGFAEITLVPVSTIHEITLDAAFLQIQNIQLIQEGAGTALPFSCSPDDRDDNLRIALPRAFSAKETLVVRIEYHSTYHNQSDPNNLWGSYGKGLRFFEPGSTEPRKRRQVWSMGEPQGNRYWFPSRDAPDDLRSCELRLTVPRPLRVVATGQLVHTRENADGTTLFHWKNEVPHFNYQTAFVAGEYALQQQQQQGVALCTYAYPDEQEATQATIIRLPDMLHFFTELTGAKYPYPAYNQVFVQDFPWGGGQHPGMSTISENMVDDAGTHADFFYLWDGVEAQDLAAQWFGGLLTPADWSDQWLSKSFALYLDCLYSEYKNGQDEMQLWNRKFQLNTCLADWHAGNRRPIVPRNYADPALMCFDNFSLRGALVLHLLRYELGEELWKKVLRKYVSQYAGKVVTTADFQRVVEQVAATPMAWFFDQWVYKTGHPVFEIDQQYEEQKHQLLLIIKQIQQPDSLDQYPRTAFFQGSMDIEIGAKTERVFLEPRAENRFVFSAPAAPGWINIDAGHAWIRELRQTQTAEAWRQQCLYSKDIMARSAALSELANLYRADSTAPALRQSIAHTFQTLIAGDAYWRLRYTAMQLLQGLNAGKPLDAPTETLLFQVIQREKSWNRAAAVAFLGSTAQMKYDSLYLSLLEDESDRVINAAANALGKSRSPRAYEALIHLKDKASWKNQRLISALNGLRELGDPRAADLALASLRDTPAAARWTLATPVWDFRLAAAETLRALGKGMDRYSIVYQRFVKSLEENDLHDVFSNLLLVSTLADARGLEWMPIVREKYKGCPECQEALNGFEAQLQAVGK